MTKTITTLLILFILTACATPTVVNVIGPNDNKLTCEELSKEIEIANNYALEAQEAKKMSSNEIIIMNMCGRGDKDIFTVADALKIKI